MVRMGGFEVHSQVKSPYPKTRKWAGSNAWKYSSGWKNVRVANAMVTRITGAICVAYCIKVPGFIDHCRMLAPAWMVFDQTVSGQMMTEARLIVSARLTRSG